MAGGKVTFWTLILSLCCVCVLAGYALFSVTVSNQNSDIANLELQIQEYEQNLTLTRAELIIANEDRNDLLVTIADLEEQLEHADTETVAILEAELSEAQTALAEKDAEISELKSKEEEYAVICQICNLRDCANLVGFPNFSFTYENPEEFYLTDTISYDGWAYYLNGSLGDPFSMGSYVASKKITVYSYVTSTYYDSLNGVYSLMCDYATRLVDLGIDYARITMGIKPTTAGIQGYFIPSDFVAGVDAGNITISNWYEFLPYISNFIGKNGFTVESTSVSMLYFDAIIPKQLEEDYSELNSIVIGGESYSVSDSSVEVFPNYIIDEKLDVDNLFISTDEATILIDKSFKSLLLTGYSVWESLCEGTGEPNYIEFGDNVFIDCLYVPRDFDTSRIKEDISSKIGEYRVLPFNMIQLECLPMYGID